MDVGEHAVAPAARQVCDELTASLPEVLDDAVRRDVDPALPGVAAWGRPPIILRCGVSEPTGLDPTSAVLEVSGVGWRSLAGDGGTFFYTADRVAVVEVAIPDDYAPEAEVLLDLTEAVDSTVGLLSEGPAAD